jgi:hypothetical protein
MWKKYPNFGTPDCGSEIWANVSDGSSYFLQCSRDTCNFVRFFPFAFDAGAYSDITAFITETTRRSLLTQSLPFNQLKPYFRAQEISYDCTLEQRKWNLHRHFCKVMSSGITDHTLYNSDIWKISVTKAWTGESVCADFQRLCGTWRRYLGSSGTRTVKFRKLDTL